MPSEAQLQSDLANLQKAAADLLKAKSIAETSAAKARADANEKRRRAYGRTSTSASVGYLRDAERLDKRACDDERKAAGLGQKLADNQKKQAGKFKELDGVRRATARKEQRSDEFRRRAEKQHATEVARLQTSTVRVIHEVRPLPPPKPEPLRVLYLTANPGNDVRVDVEVRNVLEAVRRSTHREQLTFDHRPAATFLDLLNGLNDVRPHIVHFAGHGAPGNLLLDDAKIDRDDEEEEGASLSLKTFAVALGATTTRPLLVVLNACSTFDGAEALLSAVHVVLAMDEDVSDSAASMFAERFYAAVASAQSLEAAIAQGRLGMDAAGANEGQILKVLARTGVLLESVILVQPKATADY